MTTDTPTRNPDVLFSDLGSATKLAPKTPLTREAVVHLRAAGAEIDRTYGRVRSLLHVVERALAEPLGGPEVFTEEERMDLAELVNLARELAEREMVVPIFARARGERDHGGIHSEGGA